MPAMCCSSARSPAATSQRRGSGRAARAGAAPAGNLPSEVVQAAAARLAEADPGADLRLAVSCPGCGHQWRAVFDIVSFFWSELDAWAGRMLREVHILAS